MNWFACSALLLVLPAAAETLHYSINWPSGLSLGEASIRSDRSGAARGESGSEPGWEFEVNLDAAVPGFAIRDRYLATADAHFCSIQLEKTAAHGQRKTEERETFDQRAQTVTRETLHGGGKSEFSMPACARDALTFLQFVRAELAQGRLAPHQPVVLGARYDLQLTYVGTETLRLAGQMHEADKVRIGIKGPQAALSIEVYFAHDASRTPLKAVLPLPLGAFTVELLP
jgi:hypothetical protein